MCACLCLQRFLALGGLFVSLSGSAAFGAAPPAAPPPSIAPAPPPAATAPASPAPPQPDPLADFAIFGLGSVTLDSSTKVNAGLVGSNGDVSLGPFSHFAGIDAGGRLGFSSTGGGSTIAGPITVNGDIMLGQDSTVQGNLNGGGSIGINDRGRITGNIIAAGSVLLAGGQGGVIGNIQAGSNVSVGTFGTVIGNILANGGVEVAGTVNGSITCQDISVDPSGQVSGKATKGKGTVTPAKYVLETLPPADPFQAGKDDSTGVSAPDAALKPGHYGSLNAPASRQIYLKPGDYYFDSITLGDSSSINFVSLSANNGVHVFVKGDVHVGLFVKTFVKGQPLATADTALAKKVLWEVLGSVTTAGSDEWFGTIFAPKGAISLGGNTTLAGSLISGDAITAGVFFTQTFVPSGKFTGWPPPAAPAAPMPTPPAPAGGVSPTSPIVQDTKTPVFRH